MAAHAAGRTRAEMRSMVYRKIHFFTRRVYIPPRNACLRPAQQAGFVTTCDPKASGRASRRGHRRPSRAVARVQFVRQRAGRVACGCRQLLSSSARRHSQDSLTVNSALLEVQCHTSNISYTHHMYVCIIWCHHASYQYIHIS